MQKQETHKKTESNNTVVPKFKNTMYVAKEIHEKKTMGKTWV